MKDTPYTSKLDHAEDGRPLALDYFILVNDGEPEQYGIKVIEKNSGAQICQACPRHLVKKLPVPTAPADMDNSTQIALDYAGGNIEVFGCFRVQVFRDPCGCGRVLFYQFDHVDGVPKPFQVPGSAEGESPAQHLDNGMTDQRGYVPF